MESGSEGSRPPGVFDSRIAPKLHGGFFNPGSLVRCAIEGKSLQGWRPLSDLRCTSTNPETVSCWKTALSETKSFHSEEGCSLPCSYRRRRWRWRRSTERSRLDYDLAVRKVFPASTAKIKVEVNMKDMMKNRKPVNVKDEIKIGNRQLSAETFFEAPWYPALLTKSLT